MRLQHNVCWVLMVCLINSTGLPYKLCTTAHSPQVLQQSYGVLWHYLVLLHRNSTLGNAYSIPFDPGVVMPLDWGVTPIYVYIAKHNTTVCRCENTPPYTKYVNVRIRRLTQSMSMSEYITWHKVCQCQNTSQNDSISHIPVDAHVETTLSVQNQPVPRNHSTVAKSKSARHVIGPDSIPRLGHTKDFQNGIFSCSWLGFQC